MELFSLFCYTACATGVLIMESRQAVWEVLQACGLFFIRTLKIHLWNMVNKDFSKSMTNPQCLFPCLSN